MTFYISTCHFVFTHFFLYSGHPRKTREATEAVEASKIINGHTQNIKPDENGVCPCPICPKGNLIVNSLFLAFLIISFDFCEFEKNSNLLTPNS